MHKYEGPNPSESELMTADEADRLFSWLSDNEKAVLNQLASGFKRIRAAGNLRINLQELNSWLRVAQKKLDASGITQTLEKWNAIRSKRTRE